MSKWLIALYSISKEDILLYNPKALTRHVKAAVICNLSQEVNECEPVSEEEDMDEPESLCVVEGVVGELKEDLGASNKKQLQAAMLKVAGDLALKPVQNGSLFDKITLYGLLANCLNGLTKLFMVDIDFKAKKGRVTTFTI